MRGAVFLRAAALAVAYVAVAKLGLTLSFANGNITPVWPPAGIALAAILVLGRRMWLGVWLGALITNLLSAPVGAALGISVGNTLEAVVAAELLRRLVGRSLSLDRLAHVVAFLTVGALGAATIAASVGVTSLCLAGAASYDAFGSLWWVWWLGDATGVLIVTPFLLAWIGVLADRRTTAARPLEAVIVLVLVLLASFVAFGGIVEHGALFQPLAFLPFPFVIVAAMRFGVPGAATGSLIVSAFAILATRDRSPTAEIARAQIAVMLVFQTIVSGSALLMAAMAAEARRQSERYRGLLDGLPDLVARVSRQGVISALHAPPPFRISGANLVGRALGDLLPPAISSVLLAEIAVVFSNEPSRVLQLAPDLDGAPRKLEVRLVPSGDDEVTIVCRDVTELRAVEARLLVSERLASIGMLAAGVAHEVNNPLTWVLGNMDLARRHVRDLPPASAAALDRILSDATLGAQRIAGIVRDLLRLARPSGDELEVIELCTVVELSLKMAGHAIPAHVQVETIFDDDVIVRGNAARLGQVFLNVIVNALHAMSEPRERAAVLRIALRTEPNGRASIEIRDTGSGIPEDVRRHLFEPFFTTKPAGVGTGLGLAICHRIVADHRGEMVIDSAVDRGTTVRISLPAAAIATEGKRQPDRRGDGESSVRPAP